MSLNDVYLANDVLINRNLSVNGSFTIDNTRGTSDSVFKVQNNTEQYAIGIDQSDSNSFVIANSTALGTDNISRFDTSQNILLYNNLNVNGQLSLKDPIIEINNDSATTSGNWCGMGFKRNTTDVVANPRPRVAGTSPNVGNTLTTIQITNTPSDDFFNGWIIEITSGPASGDIREVIDYVNSTQLITVSSAFSSVPGADTYEIEDVRHPFVGYNETIDSFSIGSSLNINLSNPTQTLSTSIFRINNANAFIGIISDSSLNSLGTGNVIVGRNDPAIGSNTGNNNTMIGSEHGYHTTSFSNNVLIGYQTASALTNTTVSSNQILIGSGIGASGGSGLERVCIGSGILGVSTALSDYTIAIGSGSLEDVISDNTVRNTLCGTFTMRGGLSSDNTAIGDRAGAMSLSITTATGGNVFIGASTGREAEEISFNVLIGGRSAGENLKSDNNTMVGNQAGQNCTTGADNTMVGHFAGVILTTGSGNTMMGHRAGRPVITGDSNVMVGFSAGITTLLNVAPNNLTLVGSSLTLFNLTNDTASNCILIGNAISINTSTRSNIIFISNASSTARSRAICIGYASDVSTSTGFTEFKGAIIGSNADMGVADLADTNVIGYNARGTASNVVVLGSRNGTNSATVTHKIGRGTTAPAEALHIHDPDGAVAIKLSTDASGGSNDVKFQWTADDNGTPTNWSAGIDASDTNAWTLSFGTALGTTNAIKVDTSQNVTMPTGTTTTNILSSNTGLVLKGENTLWKLYSTTANTTVTLSYTASLLNKGIIIRNPSGISTDTLPTGTDMDTGRPSYANDGSDYHFKMYIVNISAFALTMAGNTGFTYIGNVTIAANSTVLLRIARTSSNTWQALRS